MTHNDSHDRSSNDLQNIILVAGRIEDALSRPLILPGSETLARAVIELFPAPAPASMLMAFAEKAIETLRDGARHDRSIFNGEDPPAAIRFQSWHGTHLEAQPLRFGRYLQDVAGAASLICNRFGPLAGFLQIDAFVRADDEAADDDPLHDLARTLEIDVEFAFLPWWACKYPPDAEKPLPEILMLNTSLCSQDELHAIAKARR